ncbi:unnamed protein product [Cuscuta epithymum]|uniref:Uncharacterized protein n=1 Tax=Cuscuta epithymum TaxID=186058 RepID=A0AAV0CGQ5_9ASTE|nr:unnamed protein product [Cuscuta epithymum]CAH9138678.1 unnamed protein product [Cuscuta epithymum]
MPPRIAEIETKYNTTVEKKRAKLGLTESDEIDSDAGDDTILEAAGVYKGRVPCMGAEGQRILYNRSGASSSRSRRGEDPRIAQMQRELEEQQRALEEQRKKEEETRARLEAMERILNAGFRSQPQPQPYILHPEQTPQVPQMDGYFHSNSGSGCLHSELFRTCLITCFRHLEAAKAEAATEAAAEAKAEVAAEAIEEATDTKNTRPKTII